jgi:pyruvate formate lyase activating enzyme
LISVRVMKLNPLITEIKGNSLDDGHGIRTVVFFKGCPLDCVWCHNPESKKTAVEISYSAPDCLDCGNCRQVCDCGALDIANPFYINRAKCNLCFQCVEVCPAKALTRVGDAYAVDELLAKILSDKTFFDVSGGGVTLSGGEPALFPEYAGSLLSACKANGIHTLVETCGLFDFAKFEKWMLPYIDVIYFDLKIFDDADHKKFCQAGNKTILEHFQALHADAAPGKFELLPRIPLVPDITDTDENLTAMARFLSSLEIKQSKLLPYNPTWYPKNARLGLPEQPLLQNVNHWQSPGKIEHCKNLFRNHHIIV